MKAFTTVLLMLGLVFGSTGCQSASKPPPRELTEEEQRALYVNMPHDPVDQKETRGWAEALGTTAAVILFLPFAAFEAMCFSGTQISTGK